MKQKILFALFLSLTLHVQAQWSYNPTKPLLISSAGQGSLVTTLSSGTCYVSYFKSVLKDGKSSFNLYLCKLDADGNKLWPEDVLITDKYTGSSLSFINLIATKDESVVIPSYDRNNSGQKHNTSVYKINPDGSLPWGKDNLQVTNSSTTDNLPAYVESLSDGSIIVSWVENYSILKIQKIMPNGNPAWSDPKTISTNKVLSSKICIAGNNDDFFITYTEMVVRGSFNLCMQKLDKNGNTLWNEPTKIHSSGYINMGVPTPSAIPDGDGGALISLALQPGLQSKMGVYFQQIGADGRLRYDGLGLKVAENTSKHFKNPVMYYHKPREVVFVAWTESDNTQQKFGMGMQRLNLISDRLEWGPEGKKLRELISGEDISPGKICADSKENILIAFQKFQSTNSAIFVRKIDFNAFPVWEDDVQISDYSFKDNVNVSTGNSNQLIFIWEKNKSIYGQKCKIED